MLTNTRVIGSEKSSSAEGSARLLEGKKSEQAEEIEVFYRHRNSKQD